MSYFWIEYSTMEGYLFGSLNRNIPTEEVLKGF